MRLVIFDFDGTIADSKQAIAACAVEALAGEGLEPVAAEWVHARIGLPLEDVFAELLPGADAGVLAALVRRYRALYPRVSAPLTRLFPGFPELLHELAARGTRLAIATGKTTAGAHRSLASLGIDAGLFDAVVGSDAVARPKPNPDMVLAILERVGAEASEAVVVGDTWFDVAMGRAAGVRTCGVTWGVHNAEELARAGADWLVDDGAALSARLLGC